MSFPALVGIVEPGDVPGVLQDLDAVQRAFDGNASGHVDGVCCFNHLYRTITSDVWQKVNSPGYFESPEFISKLDVNFAKRYIDALDAYSSNPISAPRSWQVLIDRRSDPRVLEIQFAAAGVNAHVNYDLAFALIATWGQSPGGQVATASQHTDFLRINQIFAENMEALRQSYEGHVARMVDHSILAAANNWVDDLAVVVTREWAWHHAVEYWRIHEDATELAERERGLDSLVSLAGRGILALVA